MTPTKKSESAVVLLSGGLDSSTLLYAMVKAGWNTTALSIHYGQRHQRELEAAKAIAASVGVPHQICDLTEIKKLLKGSSQTDDISVPEGHYADPVMRVTVVPNRNMILLAIAAAAAISEGGQVVAYAAHAGDHAVYPDCRPEFVKALKEALELCHYDGGVRLFTPFLFMTKASILDFGQGLEVPYELTYSCYNGGVKHCGRCGTCVERLEAFAEVGAKDPVEYEIL